MCTFVYDAHLYLGGCSNLGFPFTVKLFIWSKEAILVLPLIFLPFSSIDDPSSYFYYFFSSKSKSEGNVGSNISVPIWGFFF